MSLCGDGQQLAQPGTIAHDTHGGQARHTTENTALELQSQEMLDSIRSS